MSIFKKITLLFLSSLFLMIFIVFWVEKSNLKKNEVIQINNYITDAKVILSIFAKGENIKLQKKLSELGLQKVDKSSFLHKSSTVFRKSLTYGEIKVIKTNSKYYLYIKYLDNELIVYDKSQEDYINDLKITYLLLILDISLLIIIYLLVLKMIMPLKNISQTMKLFSSGDLSVRTDVKTGDEIGEVAESFNKMAEKLQKTIQSKEELLRDVGHELKTPIAKGKFAIEKLENSKNKEVVKKVLEELDSLTSDILQIKLLDEENLNRSKFKASTLIAEALSKLFINEDDLEIVIDDFEIDADLHYLSVALKNLVENGLKYSVKTPIVIEAKPEQITVISFGEKLDKDLEYYIQPFTRDSNNKHGYGLGLNIVKKIVDKHNFFLNYNHLNGYNFFMINLSQTYDNHNN